jgi:hypothetical protein
MLGVLFMCAACALFPVMNGIVKLLAETYDPKQIVWFRIVSHLVLVAAVPAPGLLGISAMAGVQLLMSPV